MSAGSQLECLRSYVSCRLSRMPSNAHPAAEAGCRFACTAKCLELFGAALLEKAAAAASRQETSILQVSHMCAS